MTRTITAEWGGRTAKAVVPIGVPEAGVAAMLQRQIEEDLRIGPEKNKLLLAVQAGRASGVRNALRQGVPATDVVDRRGTPVGVVAYALDVWLRGAEAGHRSIEQQNSEGAAFLSILRLLLQAGADPSLPVRGSAGGTPMWLVLAGNGGARPGPDLLPQMATLLLQHGAPVPAGMSLARIGLRNQRLLDVLVGSGRLTPAMLDAALQESAALGERDLTLKFLRLGADPVTAPRVLSQAIFRRDLELWALIRERVDVNAPLWNQSTALAAVMHEHKWMEDLLRFGANPNVRNAAGSFHGTSRTALHVAMGTAAEPGVRAASVALLLQHGALPGVRDAEGRTPLMLAHPDDADAIRLLLAAGDVVAPPEPAAAADPPMGPVSWALMRGNDALASALIRARKVRDPADCGELYYAARSGSVAALRLLLDEGASPSEWNQQEGETLLLGAAAGGHLEAARLVLERFPLAVRDRTDPPRWLHPLALHPMLARVRGRTPLMLAASAGDPELVRLLLQHGADPRAQDSAGRTARDYATRAREQGREIEALLEQAAAR